MSNKDIKYPRHSVLSVDPTGHIVPNNTDSNRDFFIEKPASVYHQLSVQNSIRSNPDNRFGYVKK